MNSLYIIFCTFLVLCAGPGLAARRSFWCSWTLNHVPQPDGTAALQINAHLPGLSDSCVCPMGTPL